ncbi:unnamed protein product, partial [Medioppia subpectinata]
MNFDVSNRFKGQPEFESGALWEDEDTRSFYQHFPDLKSIIPSILYKDCVKELDNKSDPNQKTDETKAEGEEENKEINENKELNENKEELNEENIDIIEDNLEFEETIDEIEDPISAPVVDIEVEDSDEDSSKEAATKVSNKVLLDAFFNTIVNCVNRDMMDKAAIDFCTNLNTKNNRKKLVRALFTVPRTRLDLLPFYSRFVAQIEPIMPNIATDLVALLKQDFRFLFRKKDQINIESKVKNVRFIGELVKFNIFPKPEALNCLKLLLLDFRHHHIEMTCNLLETCGRFLFRSPESHLRTKLLLDQMMRKKALLPFDSRYITNIENAYYFANPPESQTIIRVERPPMHEYIRKLLYHDLNKTNVDKILRQIRKLRWEDKELSSYAIRCLTAIWNVKFYNVRCVANLLAGLNSFQEWVAPQVIDGALEDIRIGMEMNSPKFNQRRVSMCKFLGELYNYRLVDSSIVFKVLYSFVTFGVFYDHSIYSDSDPPDNLVRIRLICQLLETCDVILLLRPKFKFATNYESALKSVDDLLKELTPRVQEVLPNFKLRLDSETMSETDDQNPGLNPIVEAEEESAPEEMSHQESDSDDEYEFPTEQHLEFRQKTTTDEDNNGSESDGIYESDDGLRGMEGSESGPKTVHCPEDDDFLKDFDKMMSESLVSRSQEVVRSNTDIVIPVNRNVTKKSVAFTDYNEPKEEPIDTPTINFMIMTRTKGNKSVLRTV